MFRKTSQQFIRDHKDEIEELWKDRRAAASSSYDHAIETFITHMIYDGFLSYFADFFSEKEEVREGAVDGIEQACYRHVPQCTEADVPVSAVVQPFYLIRDILLETEEMQQHPTFILPLMKEVDQFFFRLIGVIHDIYASSWKNKLLAQRSAMMELSAPLIPLFESITVMPIVGAIDTERAQLITQNLLYGAIKYESKVVLIDITGVAEVNTMVAQHIIKAAEAIHLIGAECIVVGIRPEIAQTMISLGIDMDMLTTLSSMSQGLRVALEKTGKEIREIN
ncbi:STAS domain-containing protein [Aneurinibacillus migulanus]|uniref:RsbT co-antagonist protein RsbR n=1 Tax=Aneurinibacillus migulanus TaxID=47500 RepID=A0A0K2WAM1_ANEMI|nr:STAS domain-containing protein [Aneurinibacillus migulanus]MCP1355264.1 STAS domain-containing protein [Aneurinibacillus migulanus]MED0896509.1 STAS domain-containing protein [Aneurinibacillus migulanus]MED1614924.1 STAS domain-containing protein [Aneurinibacillus migulanus]CEH28186.1 Putative RsbT co-antagonist protein rsbRA [Aneurinibacillus migulanus]SDJ42399.1 rsbT co-antagonist protein RsbR [Aneurinibacillus migulanus]